MKHKIECIICGVDFETNIVADSICWTCHQTHTDKEIELKKTKRFAREAADKYFPGKTFHLIEEEDLGTALEHVISIIKK